MRSARVEVYVRARGESHVDEASKANPDGPALKSKRADIFHSAFALA